MQSIMLLAATFISMVAGGSVSAQEFALYNVVADSFPKITANYIALDAAGQPYADLTEKDLRVVETYPDGRTQDLTATLTHACKTTTASGSVSMVLIVDESNSMDQVLPGGKKRLDYVKDALKLFVEKMPWNGETALSIIGFSGKSRLICDWQTSPDPVLEAIKRLVPLAATNYEVPFFGVPNVFDQMGSRSPEIPKVALFLTDGEPNPTIPDRFTFEQKAITAARAQGLRIFSATLMISRTDPSIARICQATGGRSVVANEQSLMQLLNSLAVEAISKQICKISWISPMVCLDEDRRRTASVSFRRGRQPTTTVAYVTPPQSVHSVSAAPSMVVFGDAAPGETRDSTIVIRADNSDIRINGIAISNTQNFRVIDFVPRVIKRGDSAIIKVQFMQGAERITRQAVLSFIGSPSCLPTVPLIGGGGTVVVTTPNGGEVLTTCESTRIRWTGIRRDQPVRLEFTCDGISWISIADSVTGDWFDWQPPVGCPTGRVRVTTIAGERLLWAKRLGGVGQDIATAIAVDPSGDRIYATGYFVGDTKIDTIKARSALNRSDGYFAVLDADGNFTRVTFLRGDVGANERLCGVLVDPDSNVIIAGSSASQAAVFGAESWPRMVLDQQAGFVAKYTKRGELLWRLTLAGNDREGSFIELKSLRLKLLNGGGYEILAGGEGSGFLSCYNTFGSVIDEVDLTDDKLSAIFLRISSGGQPKTSVLPDGVIEPDPAMKVAEDASGYRYRTDSFEGTFIAPFTPPAVVISEGQKDVWIMRTAIGVAVSDVSDKTFRVLQPRLATPLQNVVMDSTAIGRSATFSAPIGLRNIGTTWLRIDSVVIAGAHPDDFDVIDELDSVLLDTGGVRSLELRFTPTGLGPRSAIVKVYGSCGTFTSFTVSGEGRPECDWENKQSVDLGRHVVGTTFKQKIDCIILSQRRGNIRCSLAIKGSPDFQITPSGVVTLRSGECINVTVTYTPTQVGLQTAQLDINLPIECGIAFTQIQAEGVKPELSIEDVDLGNQRLGTSATAAVRVVNNGVVDVDLTSITLRDTAGTGITATLPALPVRVAAGDTLRIPAQYAPWQRGSALCSLDVRAQGIDTVLRSHIRGNGYQPVLQARGFSFAPVLVGAQSQERGVVRVWNRDARWPLTVTDVQLPASQTDFTWETAMPSWPVIIPPGDSLDLPVRFAPAAVGTRRTTVRMVHDGLPGTVPPYKTDSVDVDGVGLQRSVLPPLVMDTILTCQTDTAYVDMMNDDLTAPLQITGVRGSGDVVAFSIEPAPPFSIPPSSSQRMQVIFQPSTTGRATAAFSYDNPRNAELVVNVTAVGLDAPIAVSIPATFRSDLGATFSVPVVLDIAPPSVLGLAKLSVLIRHHPTALRSTMSYRDVAAGWSVTMTYPSDSVLRVDGVYAGAQPIATGQFVSIDFGSYLSAAMTSSMQVRLTDLPNCLVPQGSDATVTIDNVCYTEGRLVSIGAGRFGLQPPVPNPVRDVALIRYGLGIDCEATFRVIDIAGRVVRSWQLVRGVAGTYETTLDVSGLAAGVYHLLLHAGPFTSSQPLVIP
ncbi:MAG: choice-of-anchor D domain-containing protein [Candidatus Kapabacteria bacterium]|nr:choice-of-anchor D domain-containing protein [Candidatus Kapabacteria bacterium]